MTSVNKTPDILGRVGLNISVSKKKTFVVPNITQFHRKYKRNTVNRYCVAIGCQTSEDRKYIICVTKI